jgi:hypothetical protein
MCYAKPGPRCDSYLANQSCKTITKTSEKVVKLLKEGKHDEAHAEQQKVESRIKFLEGLDVSGSNKLIKPTTSNSGEVMSFDHYSRLIDKAELQGELTDKLANIALLNQMAADLEDIERNKRIARSLKTEDLVQMNLNLSLLTSKLKYSDVIRGMASKGWEAKSDAERAVMTPKQVEAAKNRDKKAKKRYSNMSAADKDLLKAMLRVKLAIKVLLTFTSSLWKERESDIEKEFPARVTATGKSSTPEPSYSNG